jgi:outer membrane protein
LKKIILAVAAIIATSTTFAQQKIGHLNSTEILQSMPEYKTMSEAVEKKKGEYAKLMETMYAEYDKKTKELQANTAMPQAMQDVKVQEVKDLEKRMGDFEQKAQGELSTYAQTLAKPLQDKYLKGVKEVAKEQGYSYVLDLAANGVVYSPETGSDLTQAVKTKIGANMTPPVANPAGGTRPSAGGKK